MVKLCLSSGINFFDNAEFYSDGIAETILGKILKRLKVPREEVVISTKIYFKSYHLDTKTHPNSKGLSRKRIIEGLKLSLERLQLEYVDVVFCSRPDSETPLEETVRTMNWVIEKGWALYWGTSEWPAETIKEVYGLCDKLGLIKPIVEQVQYNMVVRERFEGEYGDLFDNYKMGSTIWAPLAGGLLTGKYVEEIPKDSRVGKIPMAKGFSYDPHMGTEEKRVKFNEKILKLKDLAKSLDCSISQLALAWTLKNKDVTVCMIGASNVNLS
jgi:voltage-dependent potassium channel beta subunit